MRDTLQITTDICIPVTRNTLQMLSDFREIKLSIDLVWHVMWFLASYVRFHISASAHMAPINTSGTRIMYCQLKIAKCIIQMCTG